MALKLRQDLCVVTARKGNWKSFPSQEGGGFKRQISAKTLTEVYWNFQKGGEEGGIFKPKLYK